MIWECVCGKKFEINGTAIRCVGLGHSVYLAPEYFKDILTTKEEPKPDTQAQVTQQIPDKIGQTSLF
jgi:hypothetical protein